MTNDNTKSSLVIIATTPKFQELYAEIIEVQAILIAHYPTIKVPQLEKVEMGLKSILKQSKIKR